MSGVIDKDGTQYEHCNQCGAFINMDLLLYGWSEKHNQMADLCPPCASGASAKGHRVVDQSTAFAEIMADHLKRKES